MKQQRKYQGKFKIHYINNKIQPGNYIGMNKLAYEELFKIPYPYAKNVILILKNMKSGTTRRTINHEKIEYSLMSKGLKYKEAHKIALKKEGKI